MKTFLTILFSVIAGALIYYLFICPRCCPGDQDLTGVGFLTAPVPTSICFKGYDGTTPVDFQYVVNGTSTLTGTMFPTDHVVHSFTMHNNTQLKYKLSSDTSFNTLMWEPESIGSNGEIVSLREYDIRNRHKNDLCAPTTNRRGILSLETDLVTYLNNANHCVTGLTVCELGNTSNCQSVGSNGSFDITVSVNPETCEANGIEFKCSDGQLLGRLRHDDPDDVNIRVVLGGLLDKELKPLQGSTDPAIRTQ